MEEIKGQYSIFGGGPKTNGIGFGFDGYDGYGFDRYIGQKVRDSFGEHVIKKIELYYTIYEDGMVGTPHDMSPVDHNELMEYLRNAIKTHVRFAKETDDFSQRSIHLENIRKLTKAIKEEEKRGENDEKR